MEVYTSTKSYTSHSQLSPEEEKAFNDQIPELLPTEIDGIEIFNAFGEYVPPISAHDNPGKE